MITLQFSLLLLFVALVGLLFRLIGQRIALEKPNIAEKCFDTSILFNIIWLIMVIVAVIDYF